MTGPTDRIAQLCEGTRGFIADAGLETTMVFHKGFDLPLFAAFTLLDTPEGRTALREYYMDFVRIARKSGQGLVLDTPTWRASRGWGPELGLYDDGIAEVNRRSVEFVAAIRAGHESLSSPMILNGIVGPQGDGYNPDRVPSAEEAQDYHAHQIGILRDAGVDMVTAMTLTSSNEGIGIARAASAAGIPHVIGFTVETDGRLPTGETMAEAVTRMDAATGEAPLFYMINCAHPDHFRGALSGDWIGRIGAVRANASRRSHAELDEAEDLDAGDPIELAQDYVELRALLPKLRLMGGCCGTDHRHIGAITHACSVMRAA